MRIWFWQRIVSPHMAGLAAALAEQGCEVVYVAEQRMSLHRARLGWSAPELGQARLELAPTLLAARNLVNNAPVDSLHVCQGIRANGLIGKVQRELAKRGLKQWAVMETVEDNGLRGFAKRYAYRHLFSRSEAWLSGVLATGYRMPDWVVARGVPPKNVFPFAYFLPDDTPNNADDINTTRCFKFIFVGRLIERKRLNLLISAIGALGRNDVDLTVIGSGPKENQLRGLAEKVLAGRVHWLGKKSIEEVQAEMSKADCLVLPSRHDGWGAVVSEALMVGTPVICSDSCGSAGVVQASRVGGVFASNSRTELTKLLGEAVDRGKVNVHERTRLAAWSKCLGAGAGAAYLQAVLTHATGRGARPAPPWDHTAASQINSSDMRQA